MTLRGVLLFLLGAWCGASVFMWLVATQNFAVAARLLDTPSDGLADTAAALSPENLRLVLRHQASEVNRVFFNAIKRGEPGSSTAGGVQVPLAVAAFALAWRIRSGKLLLAGIGLMLLITLVLQFYVVPETILLGRLMDFVPREPPPPEAAPFWRLHGAYTALDMLKFMLGLAAGVVLLRQPAQRA